MIFVVGGVNGILKIYHNESTYLKHKGRGGPRAGDKGSSGGFDDDDDDSPVRRTVS